MKRRHRKPFLDINGESDSPSRGRWPNERQSQNGSPSNPLSSLITQYNSDSEGDDETKPRANKLNDQVNDFLKEIQSIAPDSSDNSSQGHNSGPTMAHPGSYWQECYDEQTGYPYYWHTDTNQVTWEIPAELKAYKEKGAAAPHSSHVPQWSNVPSSKYSSSNIPDGMIPKEVVQRNRNRQAGIKTTPNKPANKPSSAKTPGFKHYSDDEGKIEMITSFGNDESESEESEKEEEKKPAPMPRKSALKAPKLAEPPSKPREPSLMVGPALPPMHYGPPNRESLSEKLAQSVSREKKSSPSMSSNEDDILTRLKNQAKLLQKNSTKPESGSSRSNDKDGPQKDLKLSLVPGYDDDSEGEEETRKSSSTKPLFPIAEASNSNSNPGKVAKNIETNTGKIRIYEYKNSELNNAEEKNEEENKSTEVPAEKPEEEKTDLESKANKFLESIETPSKAFQRKKRIAFDVAPTKSKAPEPAPSKEDSSPPVHTTDGAERRGFGFSKEDSPDDENSKGESDAPSKKSMGIAFVKSSSSTTEESNSNCSASAAKTKEITEADKVAMRELTEPIMEKLKFLSEGSPAASAVQVMAIQIQTLQAAWELGSLSESYLRNWLTGTGCELTRLEQTAAPPGWECQWDRSHKRYYYRNISTGEAQWTYPETGIAGGAEEMELCTTPPPPEHEEPPIIEMSAQAATMSTESSRLDGSAEQKAPAEAPPPPTISGPPSPPPPPRINAEDLKRGRKRKSSPDDTDSTSKDETSKEPKPNEPLPPGVDPPEIAYALPASALEAGVLYGAQQTNPIYAATLAGAAAGIPLLSHPHTALMQGQLMHYSPAYHQHLHNQALVAARLSGQEAVAQFMVAEYARVYDQNNQVIAKPPVKMPHEASLGSALNSFYSDIASIEKSSVAAEAEKERLQAEHMRLAAEIPQQPVMMQAAATIEGEVAETKEKKKKKLKTGIGKKQKEMSSMVAKWQRAQMNYKEGH